MNYLDEHNFVADNKTLNENRQQKNLPCIWSITQQKVITTTANSLVTIYAPTKLGEDIVDTT